MGRGGAVGRGGGAVGRGGGGGEGGGRCRSTECLTKSSLTVGMCTELTLGGLRILQTSESVYTAHEGLSLANQNSRKLGGIWPEVGGKPLPIYC